MRASIVLKVVFAGLLTVSCVAGLPRANPDFGPEHCVTIHEWPGRFDLTVEMQMEWRAAAREGRPVRAWMARLEYLEPYCLSLNAYEEAL